MRIIHMILNVNSKLNSHKLVTHESCTLWYIWLNMAIYLIEKDMELLNIKGKILM